MVRFLSAPPRLCATQVSGLRPEASLAEQSQTAVVGSQGPVGGRRNKANLERSLKCEAREANMQNKANLRPANRRDGGVVWDGAGGARATIRRPPLLGLSLFQRKSGGTPNLRGGTTIRNKANLSHVDRKRHGSAGAPGAASGDKCAKQTQFVSNPCERQVPCGKGVMSNWTSKGRRRNKANLAGSLKYQV